VSPLTVFHFFLHHRDACGGESQHHLDAGAAQRVNQFIDGPLGLLDQFHHRHKRLPILCRKTGQRFGVVLVDRADVLLRIAVIGSSYGGSLLYKRIRSRILIKLGLRTAAQLQTESWTLSFIYTYPG
jgi:hypothetical protein